MNRTQVSRRAFLEGLAGAGVFAGMRAFAAPCGMFSKGKPNLVFGIVTDIHVAQEIDKAGNLAQPCQLGGPQAALSGDELIASLDAPHAQRLQDSVLPYGIGQLRQGILGKDPPGLGRIGPDRLDA